MLNAVASPAVYAGKVEVIWVREMRGGRAWIGKAGDARTGQEDQFVTTNIGSERDALRVRVDRMAWHAIVRAQVRNPRRYHRLNPVPRVL